MMCMLVCVIFVARLGLNARFFGGRKVQASYYDDDKFSHLDLTA